MTILGESEVFRGIDRQAQPLEHIPVFVLRVMPGDCGPFPTSSQSNEDSSMTTASAFSITAKSIDIFSKDG